jgi:hypothetical protein
MWRLQEIGECNKRVCYRAGTLHVNNGLGGEGFVLVISADRRYPALVAGYQGSGDVFHIESQADTWSVENTMRFHTTMDKQ